MEKGFESTVFAGWGLIAAVLLLVFPVTTAWAAEMTDTGDVAVPVEAAVDADELLDLIQDRLAAGISVEALTEDLLAQGVPEEDIICGLMNSGIEHLRIIVIALNSGMSTEQVHAWATECGASLADVQVGYSMAGVPFSFQSAEVFSQNSEDYLYNRPEISPSPFQ